MKEKGLLLKFLSYLLGLQKGWTPLHHAVANNQGEVVEWLLDGQRKEQTRLDVDAKTEVCLCVLCMLDHVSGMCYSPNIVHSYMCNGAFVHSPLQKGHTALMTAAGYSQNEMCKLLLKQGAKADCTAAVSCGHR